MRKWGPLIAVSLGAFMLLIDTTIVIVALPEIGRHNGSGYADLQWVMDGYALALAALLLGAGALADIVGRKRVYLVGLVLFTAASLLCGLAPGTGTLVGARVLQGIGGAAMLATAIALLGDAYEGRDRGIAFGVWGAVSGASAALGPILGGLLTEHVGWRAIFLVNLPAGAVTLFLAGRMLRESYGKRDARVDVPGAAAFTVAAGAATYALIRAGGHGWSDRGVWTAVAASAVAVVVFCVVESRSAAPMLDLGLLANRSFTGILVGGMAMQFAAFGWVALASVWLQGVLDHGAVQAGLMLSPLAVVAFVVSALSGRLLHGVSPRWIIGGGLLFIGAGVLLLNRVDAGSDWTALVPGLLVIGIGVGLGAPSLAGAVLGTVPPAQAGMAGGAVNTFRQLGFAFGVAVTGVLFRDKAESVLGGAGLAHPGAAAEALAGGRVAPDAAGRAASESAFASGLDAAVTVCGLVGLAAGVLVMLLVRTSGPAATAPREEAAVERPKVAAHRSAAPGA